MKITSSALLPVLGWMSTGMPRPLSATEIVLPSAPSVTTIREAWPFMTSSTALSTISQSRWCSPALSTPPMYMPGRRRTASRPSRTVIDSALYVPEAMSGFPCGSRRRGRLSTGSRAECGTGLRHSRPARPAGRAGPRRGRPRRASRAGGCRSPGPPGSVTGYLVARTICVAPRLVLTVRPSRILLARAKPRTRSLASSLIAVTPLAGPETTLASATGKIRTRADRVARQTFSVPSVASTPTTRSSLTAGSSRTTDRPLRVETTARGARANRRTLPPAVSAIAYGGGGRLAAAPSPFAWPGRR